MSINPGYGTFAAPKLDLVAIGELLRPNRGIRVAITKKRPEHS